MDLTGMRWRKSSFSEGNGGACVEVATHGGIDGIVAVRDSKDTEGPALTFSAEDWRRFTASIKG
jgi:hypothetical protein